MYTDNIIQFDPYKAKRLVTQYKNTGKVDIAKIYYDNPEKILTRLNDGSDRKYENEIVEMYQVLTADSIQKFKKDYMKLFKEFKSNKFTFNDDLIPTTSTNEIDYVMRHLINMEDVDYALLPVYEKAIYNLAANNVEELLDIVQSEIKMVTAFIESWKNNTNPSVIIANEVVVNFRNTLIHYEMYLLKIKTSLTI